MGLQEKFEQHWLGALLLVTVLVAGATWTTLNEVLVRPRDEELSRLQRRLDELEAKVKPSPSPADQNRSISQSTKGTTIRPEISDAPPSNSDLPEVDVEERSQEKVEVVEGLTFALKGCTLAGDEIDCDLSVTPDRDKRLTFWGSSRLLENDGTELVASRISLGAAESRRGRYSSIQKDLVRGVPMKLGVSFAGVKSDSESVKLIELVCSGLRVQFRDVALMNDN